MRRQMLIGILAVLALTFIAADFKLLGKPYFNVNKEKAAGLKDVKTVLIATGTEGLDSSVGQKMSRLAKVDESGRRDLLALFIKTLFQETEAKGLFKLVPLETAEKKWGSLELPFSFLRPMNYLKEKPIPDNELKKLKADFPEADAVWIFWVIPETKTIGGSPVSIGGGPASAPTPKEGVPFHGRLYSLKDGSWLVFTSGHYMGPEKKLEKEKIMKKAEKEMLKLVEKIVEDGVKAKSK